MTVLEDSDRAIDRMVWKFRHPVLSMIVPLLRSWFSARCVCGYCDHFFDPGDERAHVPQDGDPRYSPSCPACTMMNLSGDEAWAVWNSCNGIFEIRHSRKEAQALLPDFPECEVIPVRVFEDENRDMREWAETREAQP